MQVDYDNDLDQFILRGFPWDMVRDHVPGVRMIGSTVFVPASPFYLDRINDLLDHTTVLGGEHEITKPAGKRGREIVQQAPVDTGEALEKGKDGLYAFQRQVVDWVKDRRRVIVAASMGLGKTVMAIKALDELGDYPAVVVCPASVKEHWRREIKKWAPSKRVEVLNGQKPYDPSNEEGLPPHVVILNYHILPHWQEMLVRNGVKAVIFDEAHALKNPQAQRSKAALTVGGEADTVIMLTGTPIVNFPVDLVHPLNILGTLEMFGGRHGFEQRYNPPVQRKTRGGQKYTSYKGTEQNLGELHEYLTRTVMARIRREDVIEQLPPLQRSVVPVELSNHQEYKKAEDEFLRWLAEKLREKGESAMTIRQKLQSAEKAGAMMQINALKKVAALGKVKATAELVENAVEEGEQVIVFTHHREVAQQIFDTLKVPRSIVMGTTPDNQRQFSFDSFQKGDTQVIVGTLGAMSEGVTLTAAKTIVFAEMGWTPREHEQAEARAYARLNDMHGLNALYVVAEGTIDEYIWSTLDKKRRVIGEAVDGEDVGFEADVLQDYVERLE